MVARQQLEKLICRSEQRIHETCTIYLQWVSPLFCLIAPLWNQVVIYRSKTQNIYRLPYYNKAPLIPLYAPVWPSRTSAAALQGVQAIPYQWTCRRCVFMLSERPYTTNYNLTRLSSATWSTDYAPNLREWAYRAQGIETCSHCTCVITHKRRPAVAERRWWLSSVSVWLDWLLCVY